jgi:hypothetical protein
MGKEFNINHIGSSWDSRENQMIFYYEMISFLGGSWDIPIKYYALTMLDKKKEYREYAKGVAKHIQKNRPDYQLGYSYYMLRAKSVILYAEYIRDTSFLNVGQKALEYKNFLKKIRRVKKKLIG